MKSTVGLSYKDMKKLKVRTSIMIAHLCATVKTIQCNTDLFSRFST